MIALIYAHPYPDRSRANRALLSAVAGLPDLEVRSLYDLYPDFAIDVESEQELLLRAELIVWQHPFYWYSVPALMKHWFDKVLARGWAYGEDGNALKGKTCLWVTTTGGDEDAFSPAGMHAFPFGAFVPPVEQTARFCQMHWAPPLVLHGAHRVSNVELTAAAERYREMVSMLSARVMERSGVAHG
ncbi:MAG: glutathione-regulated potassium-efflux system oxidoreductase KefF [Myxococcales bacterium]